MENTERQIDGLFTEVAIKDLLKNLKEKPNADAFSTTCGGLFIDGENLQVKITITRKEDDFLGDFDIVEHNTLNQ